MRYGVPREGGGASPPAAQGRPACDWVWGVGGVGDTGQTEPTERPCVCVHGIGGVDRFVLAYV